VSGLAPLFHTLPRWIIVGGKGGVGKTTCAVALAERSAASDVRTLLLSTDPARSLASALEHPLDAQPRPVPGVPSLFAAQLDATVARDAFLRRWRDILITIIDRGTYLDADDIAGLVDATLPGTDEAMALLDLADLERDARWERIVVDTAPTGHTLRLLALPDTFRALIKLFESMQTKHRFMVQALTHRYRPDAADGFLDQMRGAVDALSATLRDPARSAVVLVTRAEPVVSAETERYARALDDLGMRVSALIVNALPMVLDPTAVEALAMLAGTAPGVPRAWVPRIDSPPIGIPALAAWGSRLELGLPAAPVRAVEQAPRQTRPTPAPRRARGAPVPALEVRPLTILGGKGGVGKTSAACALAIAAALPDASVLVVSTDPAPSVADALAQSVGDADTPVAGVPGLCARQMDASAAFDGLRQRYSKRIDAVFDGFVARGIDAAHDRAVLHDLLALAPPGLDEVYALAELGETVAEGKYTVVVVDPAPTGHLLRLLEMPQLALDWSHQLMRLMLKYREVAGLGDVAGEVLGFARRTRAIGTLLGEPARAGLIAVALDEPLVRAETMRLVGAVRSLGVDVMGILWNRVGDAPPLPLTVSPPLAQFVAAVLSPPPRGVDALRRWHDAWSPLPTDHG
jgi:arsenite/tail-anchored protein-transporting ATPase